MGDKMKSCVECGDEKPLDAFNRRADTPDGRQYQCRACARALARRWAQENPDRNCAKAARVRKQNPEMVKAHSAVSNAIRRGDLVRPGCCSSCGVADRIEAHHPDYSKPLEVEWLCQTCHTEAHREARNVAA